MAGGQDTATDQLTKHVLRACKLPGPVPGSRNPEMAPALPCLAPLLQGRAVWARVEPREVRNYP